MARHVMATPFYCHEYLDVWGENGDALVTISI